MRGVIHTNENDEESMKLYWGLNSIPELRGLPKAQQKRLWRIGVRAGGRMPRVWGAYFLMVLVLIIGLGLIPPLIPNFPRAGVVYTLWNALWGGLGGVSLSHLSTHAIRPVLAKHRQAMEAKPAKDGSYYVPPAL
jgi:hypothetical protein